MTNEKSINKLMEWRKLGFYFCYICPTSAASELKTEDWFLYKGQQRDNITTSLLA